MNLPSGSSVWICALAAAVGYVLGALPSGYLIVRILRGKDVRSEGSGNIGATNVLRTTGRTAGVATLLLDIAKGALAVAIGRWLAPPDAGGTSMSAAIAFLAVVTGHVFPVTLGLRGGKGVACAVGGALVLAPVAALISIGALLATIAATRRVSPGSLVFALLFPVFLAAGRSAEPSGWQALCAAGASAIVIGRHASNIRRLLEGTEPRLGAR